jgi:hypothetical protein
MVEDSYIILYEYWIIFCNILYLYLYVLPLSQKDAFCVCIKSNFLKFG